MTKKRADKVAPDSVPFTLRIPVELKRRAQERARSEDRTLSSFILRAVRASLGDSK